MVTNECNSFEEVTPSDWLLYLQVSLDGLKSAQESPDIIMAIADFRSKIDDDLREDLDSVCDLDSSFWEINQRVVKVADGIFNEMKTRIEQEMDLNSEREMEKLRMIFTDLEDESLDDVEKLIGMITDVQMYAGSADRELWNLRDNCGKVNPQVIRIALLQIVEQELAKRSEAQN